VGDRPCPGRACARGRHRRRRLPHVPAAFPEAVANDLWAVVFVVEGAAKGTERSGQEYAAPLLALSGKEYAAMPFGVLHARLCDALRGDRPRLAAEVVPPGGSTRLVFDDGSVANAAGERKPQN
jgi:hypothetical protein